jgi:two-component sensor histidine kinase
MQEIENDEYLLVVGDDGIGLPHDLDITRATILGLLL